METWEKCIWIMQLLKICTNKDERLSHRNRKNSKHINLREDNIESTNDDIDLTITKNIEIILMYLLIIHRKLQKYKFLGIHS